jgi:HSP20 family protein
MDAWREADTFVVEFDPPGVESGSVDLDAERNLRTVRAERALQEIDVSGWLLNAPRGAFSRQLILG